MKLNATSRAALAAIAATVSLTAMSAAHAGCVGEPTLKFTNGNLRIMQFADIQDDNTLDPRSTELMVKALDAYKPDIVVFSGDNITGGDIEKNDQVKEAIDNIVNPVEARGIPFIATFGNHDDDANQSDKKPNVTFTQTEQYNYYRSFSCNVNPPTAAGITGDSNAVVLVYGSQVDPKHPKFALWVLDTGRYAKNPDELAGQNIKARTNTWDHLQPDQINWYRSTSQRFERVFGEKIPGLMWFHHPTHEFDFMWNNDFGTAKNPDDRQFGTDQIVIEPYSSIDGKNAFNRHKIVGERNECVCTGPYNAGIYAAVRERGDVKGMFVGHDHINDYHGNYHGVFLGYAASAGFGTYGFDPDKAGPNQSKQHRLRGVRVFDIDEDTREVFDTYMVKAGDDLGICVDNDDTGCDAPIATVAGRSTRLASGKDSGKELDGVDLNADISDPAVAANYEIKGNRIVGVIHGK